MKIQLKEGFILREIVGTWIVVPIGEQVVHLNSILSLSESGAVLWNKLSIGVDRNELLGCLTDAYEVSAKEAEKDLDEFLEILAEKGLLQ